MNIQVSGLQNPHALVSMKDTEGYAAQLDSLRGHYSGRTEELDMNGDHRPDFRFEYRGLVSNAHTPLGEIVTHSWTLVVMPLDDNAVALYGDDFRRGLNPMPEGADIDKQCKWIEGQSKMYSGRSLIHCEFSRTSRNEQWDGAFADNDNGILGVRVNAGRKSRFGWIRVSCSKETGELTILDWALSDKDAVGVRAGCH